VMAIVAVNEVGHRLISAIDLVLHIASVDTAALLASEHALASLLRHKVLHDPH
jgi:hypothetical protein